MASLPQCLTILFVVYNIFHPKLSVDMSKSISASPLLANTLLKFQLKSPDFATLVTLNLTVDLSFARLLASLLSFQG